MYCSQCGQAPDPSVGLDIEIQPEGLCDMCHAAENDALIEKICKQCDEISETIENINAGLENQIEVLTHEIVSRNFEGKP